MSRTRLGPEGQAAGPERAPPGVRCRTPVCGWLGLSIVVRNAVVCAQVGANFLGTAAAWGSNSTCPPQGNPSCVRFRGRLFEVPKGQESLGGGGGGPSPQTLNAHHTRTHREGTRAVAGQWLGVGRAPWRGGGGCPAPHRSGAGEATWVAWASHCSPWRAASLGFKGTCDGDVVVGASKGGGVPVFLEVWRPPPGGLSCATLGADRRRQFQRGGGGSASVGNQLRTQGLE